MKTVFLLTHIPNPRMNKRIEVAKKLGEVAVVCVRRATQNTWEPFHVDVEHEILELDMPSSRQLVKRYFFSKKYEKFAKEMLKKHRPDILYTAGIDSLGIAVSYKKKHSCKIIYEVADLREIYIETPKNAVARVVSAAVKNLEKNLLKSVDRLVVTSEKFYDRYYCNLIAKEKLLFIPNVPDLSAFEGYEKKQSGVFTAGFIGGIRYLYQMKMLVDAAEMTQCHVLFAGAGGTSMEYEEIRKYCEGKPYVSFTGRYDYNRDIAKLYGAVDCVYSVYDASKANVRIALPNKLYESVYCELPILVAKNTYLAEMVQQWGVGVAVAYNNVAELSETLAQLKNNKQMLSRMVHSCALHKSDVDWAVYADKLLDCMNTLVQG